MGCSIEDKKPIVSTIREELRSMQETTIIATVNFDKDGVQHGFLKLPYSHDLSAWDCIMIPVTVIKNGDGPTALLTGSNHGDEYEGIASLLKLANTLQPESIQGRVICA